MNIKNMKYSLLVLALAAFGSIPVKGMESTKVVLTEQQQEEQNKRLFDATYKNDIEAVKKALNDGADVGARCIFGGTPLHSAGIEVMKVLLAHGAYVDARCIFGRTVLHRAAYYGNIEAMKVLLMHGAEIDVRDISGRTPLHEAASRGESPVVLVENGADISLKNGTRDEETAYDLAIRESYYDVATYLQLASHYLSNGPKVQVTQQNAHTVPDYFALAVLKQDCADIKTIFDERELAGETMNLSYFMRLATRCNKQKSLHSLMELYMGNTGKMRMVGRKEEVAMKQNLQHALDGAFADVVFATQDK